jgi:hypothetical protein
MNRVSAVLEISKPHAMIALEKVAGTLQAQKPYATLVFLSSIVVRRAYGSDGSAYGYIDEDGNRCVYGYQEWL